MTAEPPSIVRQMSEVVLEAKPLGITILLFMYALDHPVGQKDLVALTGVTRETISDALSRLEALSMVKRLNYRSWTVSPRANALIQGIPQRRIEQPQQDAIKAMRSIASIVDSYRHKHP